MKTPISFFILATLSLASIAAEPTAAALPPGHPTAAMPAGHGAAGAADMSQTNAPLTKKAKVVSVVDAKQFTYIEVHDGKKSLWIAAPAIAVKAGDTISYADGEVMAKFHSKALNRDFTNVLFTTRVVIDK